MRQGNGSDVILEVGGEGIGLSEVIDIETIHTLGQRLVARLKAQLGGSITLSRQGGTRFAIHFADPGGATPTPEVGGPPAHP